MNGSDNHKERQIDLGKLKKARAKMSSTDPGVKALTTKIKQLENNQTIRK